MKKINIAFSLLMIIVIYVVSSAEVKIGLIRDEYNITGSAIPSSFVESVVIIVLSLSIFVLNLILFFYKKEIKSRTKYAVIIASAVVLVVSLMYILKVNSNLL